MERNIDKMERNIDKTERNRNATSIKRNATGTQHRYFSNLLLLQEKIPAVWQGSTNEPM